MLEAEAELSQQCFLGTAGSDGGSAVAACEPCVPGQLWHRGGDAPGVWIKTSRLRSLIWGCDAGASGTYTLN